MKTLLIVACCFADSQRELSFSVIASEGGICSILSAVFIFYSMFAYINSAAIIDFHVAIALHALSPVVVTLISLPFFSYSGSQRQLAGKILVVISIIAMGMTQTMNRRVG
ncbi:hypothetical protein PZA20_14650 [Pectobacterium polaris]|uniref:hypothetical protein n=1 Tax=Pectobacterium polaris TaxID=2042057 RepID=UPI0023AF8543|nr:hypothetical protein [Pectobacterium polaris]MDE8743054.1 hypothetical protein [Pectobacterium polaris]